MIDLDRHLSDIVAGDDQAFADWLVGAEPSIRRSLSSFAATVDTEAVLQEALLRVWQVAPKLTPDGRPNALLRLGVRIARNLAIDETRRDRVQTVTPERLDAVIEPVMPDPILRQALEQCWQQLTGPPARAWMARTQGRRAIRKSDRELAAELNMKLNTFLKNVGRARRALVACLQRRGVTLEGP